MTLRIHKGKDPSAEILKSIKQYYQTPNDETYEISKRVKLRTELNFAREQDSDWWIKKWNRHEENRTRGHFSAVNRPYRPIGEAELDSHTLLYSQISNSLPDDFVRLSKRGNNLLHLNEEEKVDGTDTVKNENLNEKVDIRELRQAAEKGGFKRILDHLQESSRRIIAIRAGQSYTKHVKNCQANRRKKLLEQEMAEQEATSMRIRRLSSTFLSAALNNPSVPAPLPETSNNVAGVTGIQYEDLVETNRHAMRKCKQFIDKIDRLDLVICMLLNSKSKFLKLRTPLNKDQLKSMQKEPVFKGPEETHLGLHLRSQIGPMRVRTAGLHNDHDSVLFSRLDFKPLSRSSVAPSTVMLASGRESSFAASKCSSFVNNPVIQQSHQHPPSAVKPEHDIKSKLTAAMRRGTHYQPNRDRTAKILNQETRVETWDDLLMVGSKNKVLRHLHRRPQAPWSIINQDKQTSYQKDSKAKETESDTQAQPQYEYVVSRVQKEHLKLQQQMDKTTQERLEKIEREKLDKFRHKIMAFSTMNPLWEQQSLAMSEVAKSAERDPLLFNKQTKVSWVETLVSEYKSLDFKLNEIGASALTAAEQRMESIKRFAHVDWQAVTNPVEKLCLITFSLPIHEICVPQMQWAITFVLCEMLKVDELLLKKWLIRRRLVSE